MTNVNNGDSQAAVTTLNLGFSGSRNWNVDYWRVIDVIESVFDRVSKERDFIVHVGDASGVDEYVVKLCNAKAVDVTVYGAHGKIRLPDHIVKNAKRVTPPEANNDQRGYHIRDEILAASVDVLYGIWNGNSKGTLYTCRHARQLGKRVHLLKVTRDGWEVVNDY